MLSPTSIPAPTRTHRLRALLVTALVMTVGGTMGPISMASADDVELLPNANFSQGATGWGTNGAGQVLTVRDGVAHLTTTTAGVAVLNDKPTTIKSTKKGAKYVVSARIRTTTPEVAGALRIREVAGAQVTSSRTNFTLTGTSWQTVTLNVTTVYSASSLDFNLLAWKLPVGQNLQIDSVSVKLAPTASSAAPGSGSTSSGATSSDTVAGSLSNGCTYSTRGIPSCGAYVGGAYNTNADPGSWESWLTKQIGVRRAYFSSSQVSSAVTMAKADAAKNRITWMSFKAPYSWADMASGRGDAWARDLASKLATVNGPVWVAVHHEPENDGGDIKQWTAMQARLAPIFRGAGPNVAYSIIVMGYHQFYGDAKFSLEKMWPANTKIDIAGFDIYDEYGMVKRGQTTLKHKEFRANYFNKIQAWAKPRGIAWGLAETGFSEASVRNTPSIMSKVYDDMVDTGGIALAYFNTSLNSTMDWRLNTTARKNAYKAIHQRSATIK